MRGNGRTLKGRKKKRTNFFKEDGHQGKGHFLDQDRKDFLKQSDGRGKKVLSMVGRIER